MSDWKAEWDENGNPVYMLDTAIHSGRSPFRAKIDKRPDGRWGYGLQCEHKSVMFNNMKDAMKFVERQMKSLDDIDPRNWE